jgi:hypothetical protein
MTSISRRERILAPKLLLTARLLLGCACGGAFRTFQLTPVNTVFPSGKPCASLARYGVVARAWRVRVSPRELGESGCRRATWQYCRYCLAVLPPARALTPCLAKLQRDSDPGRVRWVARSAPGRANLGA